MRIRQFVPEVSGLICVVFGLTLASSNAAAPTSKIVSFDPPGSIMTQTGGINRSGEVTGSYQLISNVNHGFLREPDGTIDSFDPVRSTNTLSWGINSSGATTGWFHDTNDYGFIREAFGNIVPFDASVGGSGLGTYPVAINDVNQVTGSAEGQGSGLHGFIRDKDGTITIFDPPGSQVTSPVAFGPNGEIIGNYLLGTFHGFIRDSSGVISTFDEPEAKNGTLPVSVNSSGLIAGFYYGTGNTVHGFTRDQAGNFTTFDAPGGGTRNSQGTFVVGINDAGEVAGSVVLRNYSEVGFVRDVNGNFTMFHVPGSGTRYQQGTSTTGLNRSGGTTGFYLDPNNVYHGFVRY